MCEKIKLVCFDLDDTLVNSSEAMYMWHHNIAEEFFLTPEQISYMKWRSGLSEPYWNTYEAIVNYCSLPISKQELRNKFLEEWPSLVKPVNGVVERILKLKELGCCLALITNGPPRLQIAKAGHHLINIFDRLYFCDGSKTPPKPDITAYLDVLEWARIPANQSVMVGDDQTNDIEPSLKVGMQAIKCDNNSQYDSMINFHICNVLDDLIGHNIC